MGDYLGAQVEEKPTSFRVIKECVTFSKEVGVRITFLNCVFLFN
jgi:hypothetical protein